VNIKLSDSRRTYLSSLNIFGLILSGLFLTWSIFAFLNMLWNFGTDWLAYIWLGLGIIILTGQISNISNKYNHLKRKRIIILQEYMKNQNISHDEVSQNTGIDLNEVKKIFLYLKIKGIINRSFNTTTGQSIVFQQPVAMTTAKSLINNGSLRFCPNCGTHINNSPTKYCEFCGIEL
jgi:hypothetical protein